MNRNHLAAFHAVARAGSISRGAEQLMTSQPAVSRQVADLEAELGVTLFDRLPRGVRLTDAGGVLAEFAHRMAVLEQEADRAIRELRGLARGRLAIGASTTIAAYVLPPVFGEFHRRHPRVELSMEVANSDVIERKLLDGELDLGLTGIGTTRAELEAQPFATDDLAVVAAPSHPLANRPRVAAADLAGESFVVREPGSGMRAAADRALADRGIAVVPVMTLGSTAAVKRAVAAGAGLAFISRLTVDLELQAGLLVVVPVSGLTVRRPLYWVRRRDKSDPYAVTALRKLLDEQLATAGRAGRRSAGETKAAKAGRDA